MKIINTGDWHYSAYAEGKIIEDKTETLYYIDKTNRNICEYARENNIKHIAVLGDIYHTKSLIYSTAQSVLLKMVREYSDLTFIFLQGNHDLSSRSKVAVSTLEGFKSEKNVIVVDKPTTIPEIKDSVWIPYTVDIVNEVKKHSAKNLFSHFGLNEGVLNSGISIVSEIGLSDLYGKYENVFIGHYHKPQEIKNDKIHLFYTGSPIQLDAGEKNEEKRFIVFDLETNEKISVPTEGYKKIYEYVVTDENKNKILEISKHNIQEGHEVRIVRKETTIDVSDFTEEFKIIDKSERDITNRGLSITMTEDARIDRYIEINEIPADEIDLYKNFALNVIEKVMSEESK